MALAANSFFLGLNSKQGVNQWKAVDITSGFLHFPTAFWPLSMRVDTQVIRARPTCRLYAEVSTTSSAHSRTTIHLIDYLKFEPTSGSVKVFISSGSEVEVSSARGFVVSSNTSESGEIKMSINVDGSKTQAIYDEVFSKLVAAAQPIPGFRRTKGGKTPDVPRDVLLYIIGRSKVKKQAISSIINSSVAEYVKKEGLKIAKDLRVVQSAEELELEFEPGREFRFDAIVRLIEADSLIST